VSRQSRPPRAFVLVTCALVAAVNLVAVAVLTPRADAPVSIAVESEPAASGRDVPAPAPPVPAPEPPPRIGAVPREAPPVPAPKLPPRIAAVPREGPPRAASPAADRAALRAALDEWIAATNRRDLARQMTFYPPTVLVFYRERNVSRSAVLEEKRRVFGRAQVVDVHAGPPDITLHGPESATMRFRKTYDIRGPQVTRAGVVVQELRWVKTPAGWKITSERDAEVIW
jgi:SnoaL-like protein